MIKTFQLHQIIIFIIVIGSIFIDLINGYLMQILNIYSPIGIIYKGIISVLMIYFMIKNKFNLYLLLAFILWFFISNLIWIVYNNSYSFFAELQSYIKLIYAFIILGYFTYLYSKNLVQKKFLINILILSGIIKGSFIVFSYFSNMSVKSYGDYSYAVRSFFDAGNDISLSILISFPFIIYKYILTKEFKYLLSIIVVLFSLFLLGTISGLGGSLGILLSYFILFLFLNRRKYKISFLKKFLSVIIFILGFSYISYLIFITINEYQYMLNKYLDLLEKLPRATLINSAIEYLSNRLYIYNIFGEGYYSFSQNIYKYWDVDKIISTGKKLVEVDYFDLYGMYGLVISFFIWIFLFFMLFKSLKYFLKNKDIYEMALFLSIIIFIIHSCMAGHAIMSGIVGTIIPIVYFLILTYKKGEL